MRNRVSTQRPRWQPPLASETRIRRRVPCIAAAIGLSLSAGGLALENIAAPPPRLLWNASASVPVGLYRVTPVRPIGHGDILVAALSGPVARLAARRHYLPLGVPLVKPVAALSGDRVCALGSTIRIDGRAVATRRVRDRIGLPLPWWNGCETLGDGRLFLLSPVADSFDGRYFGPVDMSTILGRAHPLWTASREGIRP